MTSDDFDSDDSSLEILHIEDDPNALTDRAWQLAWLEGAKDDYDVAVELSKFDNPIPEVEAFLKNFKRPSHRPNSRSARVKRFFGDPRRIAAALAKPFVREMGRDQAAHWAVERVNLAFQKGGLKRRADVEQVVGDLRLSSKRLQPPNSNDETDLNDDD